MTALVSVHLEDPEVSLAMALVQASPGPLLLLDGDLAIIRASNSFCETFSLDPADILGRQYHRLGEGEWGNPRLRSLLSAMLSGAPSVRVLEMDLYQAKRCRRRLVIQAERLAHLEPASVRIMVAVNDVTRARADQDAATEAEAEAEEYNLIRLAEVHDWVANGVQNDADMLNVS